MNGIDQIQIFPLQNSSNAMLAFASCRINTPIGGFYFRGLRIMNGQFGIFVSMPSQKDKEGKYHDHYYPESKEVRRVFQDAILEVYHGGRQEQYNPGEKVQQQRQQTAAQSSAGGGAGF